MDVWEWADKEKSILPKRDENVGRADAKNADKVIKFCNKCKQCWEYNRDRVYMSKDKRTGSNILYYQDFPNRGKEVVICKRCGGK